MKMDRTLLDKDGTPTIEEMKEYFQKHDYTTATPLVDYEKLTPPQRKVIQKAGRIFEKAWLDNLKGLGGKRSFRDFSDDYPVRKLERADADLVAGAVVQIMEDEDMYKRVLNSFFVAMQEPIMRALEEYAAANEKMIEHLTEKEIMAVIDEVADAADCRMIHLMMLTQSVPEIMEITKNNEAHEDFNENVANNFPRMNHMRRWIHSDTKVGAPLSLEECDPEGEYLGKPDESDLSVKEFLATLNDTDRAIALLRIQGMNLQEIANCLGYKTHSAVSKRIKALEQKWEDFDK